VETIVGDHRFGWITSDGGLSGFSCDFANYCHRRYCYPVAVRL